MSKLRQRDNYQSEALLLFFSFLGYTKASGGTERRCTDQIDMSKWFLPFLSFKSLLPSTSDEQLVLPNETYFSFEEIKSCGSESSQSNYYSPNSSLIDLQNMPQDFDEIANNNYNNNNNTLFNEGKHRRRLRTRCWSNIWRSERRILTTTTSDSFCCYSSWRWRRREDEV